MRAISKGEPFSDVPAEGWIPDEDCLAEMVDDADDAQENGYEITVFSEMFLYPRVGKDDARFILGVAEEYEKLIAVLGTDKIKELLRG